MDTDKPKYVIVEVFPDGNVVERDMTENEIAELPQRLETPTE